MRPNELRVMMVVLNWNQSLVPAVAIKKNSTIENFDESEIPWNGYKT